MKFPGIRLPCSVIFLFLTACAYHVDKAPPGSELTSANLSSFSGLSAGIFEPKCVQCHNAVRTEGHVDLSSYSAIVNGRGLVAGNPQQSLIFIEVQSGDMPDSGPRLSGIEVQAISDWILAGAPNGSFASGGGTPSAPPPVAPPPVTPPPVTPPPVTPPPTLATFSEVQKLILNKSCLSCHSGPHPKSQVNLSSYGAILNDPKHRLITPGSAVKSRLYTEISSGSMPPKGPGVSAKDLAVLADWINQGAKNN